MSVLFCVRTNSRARGGRARGHAAPGCSCRRGAGGPGRPPGVAAACGISIPAAPAAAVLARPQPVQSAPRHQPSGRGERSPRGPARRADGPDLRELTRQASSCQRFEMRQRNTVSDPSNQPGLGTSSGQRALRGRDVTRS
ncbi:uncharacterized protein LOC144330399 [Macaca mulatta]